MDEFSRALTSLCYTNASETPILSIIERLLCAHENNAAVVHRFSLTRKCGSLPGSWVEVQTVKGYRKIRNRASKTSTFADYARQLPKEYKAAVGQCSTKSGTQSSWDRNSTIPDETFNNEMPMEPMYYRNVVVRYIRDDDVQRRLSRIELHKKVSGKEVYCCLFPTAIQLKEMGGSTVRNVVQSKDFGAQFVGKQFVQVVGRNGMRKQC